jgi:hypothetical protein
MEHDPSCSMDTLYELCESQLWWRIGEWILFMSCVNHSFGGGSVGAFSKAKGGGKEKDV